MAYFANGTEGMDYQARFCDHCVHNKNQDCPIWLLHLLHNYVECNKSDSFLHVLIPRKGITNDQCTMFIDSGEQARREARDEALEELEAKAKP